MGGGRFDELGDGRTLALGPIGEATVLDHATDPLEAIEDRADELDGFFEPPSELLQVDAHDRAAIRARAGTAHRSGKARLDEFHRRASDLADAQELRIVGKVMMQLAPVDLYHFPSPNQSALRQSAENSYVDRREPRCLSGPRRPLKFGKRPRPLGRSSLMTFFEAEQPAEDRLTAIHDELPDAGSRRPEALSLPFGQLGFSDAELSRELLWP
jgi:hypothetical protein